MYDKCETKLQISRIMLTEGV